MESATSAAAASGYTLRVVRINAWRVYNNEKQQMKQKCNLNMCDLIDQYYVHEDASSMKGRHQNVGSFPFHHCLMRASLSSAQKLLNESCLYPLYASTSFNTIFNSTCIDSKCALTRTHTTKQTPFTTLTVYQKRHLTSQSAMAGLLVSRLFGISSAKPHTIQSSKKCADNTVKYIHSAFASECLVGNRYYYNLPTILSEEKCTVGQPSDEKQYRNIKAEDATYEKIQETREQLVYLYNANIERLENAIKQFRRGLLSIQTIREDSEYKKMFEMFWILQVKSMKYLGVTQSGMSAHQAFCESNNIIFDEITINIMLCNLVFSCQAVCPRLFAYEIVHLFDNRISAYATYVKTTKAKQLELCSKGLISAFLTFSAIEPNMVSTHFAPHVEEIETISPYDLSRYAFHISSRDEIFGPLISKHRHHIPQPARITRTFFMTKDNKDCFYLPVQEALIELRTGKKAAKESWKKNKNNFKNR
jgi:hypothetical protein